MDREITININGTQFEKRVPIRMLLIDFIRYEAGLTGSHVGCTFEGVCGACTVHLDGDAVKSCLLLAVQCDGHQITTVEGLSQGRTLHPLQDAFHRHHGLQCGYCTSGMLMTAADFIRHNQHPSEEEVRHAIIGNICRCTGYSNIVDAIIDAAGQRNSDDSVEEATNV
jgi:aerobic-type carbon monoxide dehydrogenase small subunit (CoxS/CutS family)